ncbi:hypothetical protein ACKGJO_02790 [Gracilimonas sp. Q87]|uniref:hypothetical protein n=1 Tax=Gracilimonas sp. Q87 TaxID=3384766 RepID=UPI0039841296
MFLENNFYIIFGSSLFVVLLFIIAFKFWEGKPDNELDKAISGLKINIFMVGFLSLVLWFLLPSTPSLQSFGFPQTVGDVQTSEQILNYLQEYNQAIVRTTDVVYWFIFVFVWGFLSSLYTVIKTFKSLKGKEYFGKVREQYAE